MKLLELGDPRIEALELEKIAAYVRGCLKSSELGSKGICYPLNPRAVRRFARAKGDF